MSEQAKITKNQMRSKNNKIRTNLLILTNNEMQCYLKSNEKILIGRE